MKNDKIHVSIIIIAYNVSRFIAKCVESAISQTYLPLEIIIVNDGSTDDTKEICEKYTYKYNYIKLINQENKGSGEARNTGIRNAIGTYLVFIDGDDYILPKMVEHLVDVIKVNKGLDFVQGRMSYFYDNDASLKLYSDPIYLDDKWISDRDGQSAFIAAINHSGKIRMGIRGIYKKEFIEKNQLFFKPLVFSQDAEWVARVFVLSQKCGGCEYPDYCYRDNRIDSVSSGVSIEKAFSEILVYEYWVGMPEIYECKEDFLRAFYNECGKRFISVYIRYARYLSDDCIDAFINRIDKDLYIMKLYKGYDLRRRLIQLLVSGFGFSMTTHLIRFCFGKADKNKHRIYLNK